MTDTPMSVGATCSHKLCKLCAHRCMIEYRECPICREPCNDCERVCREIEQQVARFEVNTVEYYRGRRLRPTAPRNTRPARSASLHTLEAAVAAARAPAAAASSRSPSGSTGILLDSDFVDLDAYFGVDDDLDVSVPDLWDHLESQHRRETEARTVAGHLRIDRLRRACVRYMRSVRGGHPDDASDASSSSAQGAGASTAAPRRCKRWTPWRRTSASRASAPERRTAPVATVSGRSRSVSV